MVQGIGPTGSGSGGSIKDLSAYQTYYPMYEAYCQSVDDNLSFEAWLIMKACPERDLNPYDQRSKDFKSFVSTDFTIWA